MKKVVTLCMIFTITLLLSAKAQTQKAVTGVVSQGSKPTSNTSGVDGLKRKGSGKMATGISRSGNTNLSPTNPTQTGKGASQGSRSTKTQGQFAPKSTKKGTATDNVLNSTGASANNSSASTSNQSASGGRKGNATGTQSSGGTKSGSSGKASGQKTNR